MSFTIIKKFQVPWIEFPKVEKQLHCSAQRFLVDEKLEYIIESCEQFMTDYWSVKQYEQSYMVEFLSLEDVLAFKIFFPNCKQYNDDRKYFKVSYGCDPLKTFSITFLKKLERYAQRRKDKTVKFNYNIYRLCDIQDAIIKKSDNLNKKFPEFDKISTKKLLQYYRTRQDNILVHNVGQFSRKYIKQVLDTREHV